MLAWFCCDQVQGCPNLSIVPPTFLPITQLSWIHMNTCLILWFCDLRVLWSQQHCITFIEMFWNFILFDIQESTASRCEENRDYWYANISAKRFITEQEKVHIRCCVCWMARYRIITYYLFHYSTYNTIDVAFKMTKLRLKEVSFKSNGTAGQAISI